MKSLDLAFLATILDRLPDPVFVKDREHRWIFANSAFSSLLGLEFPEYHLKSDHDLFPKEIADVFWEKDDEIFKSNKPNENEELIIVKGETRTLLTKKFPIETNQGLILVGIIRDITEHKSLENNKLELEKMRTFNEVISGLAHDINNPLCILKGRIQHLERLTKKDDFDLDVVRPILTSMAQSCERVIKVVSDLRALTLDNETNSVTAFSISFILNQISSYFTTRFMNFGIEFELKINHDQSIKADETILRQALIILSNTLLSQVKQTKSPKIMWTVDAMASGIKITMGNNSQTHRAGASGGASIQNPEFALGEMLAKGLISSQDGNLEINEFDSETRFVIQFKNPTPA